MRPHYSITSQPASEPVTYADLASHLRVDSTDDQAYVTALISVAREYIDRITGRASISTAYLLAADSWSSAIGLPTWYELEQSRAVLSPVNIRLYRAPLIAVQSVKYYAPGAASLTTMSSADYRVITTTEPGSVQIFQNLPSVADRPDAIQIAFTAGHANIAAMNAMHKHAVKLMAAILYENRMPIAPVDMKEIPHTLVAIVNNIKVGGWTA